MDNIKSLKYTIPFFFIGSIILVLILNKITDETFKQFPLIKYGETVNVVILETKSYKGTTLLKDVNGKCFSVRANDWNKKPYLLYNYIDIGDSISLESNSNTLYLFKKKDESILEFKVQYLD